MTMHEITHVRHDVRRRTLTVASVDRLTPRMVRIGFTSPELADFASASPDDHIKIFFPAPTPASASGQPCMRDFTPRAFRPERGALTIDFAVHEAGPAAQWAMAAAVGQTLEIGGPRGSSVVPDDFAWYWLIGDETALPAIGRRVEGLRAGVPVTTFVVVHDAEEIQTFETSAAWQGRWCFRSVAGSDDAASLRAALSDIRLPPGDGFVWIAAETSVARAVRRYLVEERGHPLSWTKAAGYWKRGDAGAHERIDDEPRGSRELHQ